MDYLKPIWPGRMPRWVLFMCMVLVALTLALALAATEPQSLRAVLVRSNSGVPIGVW